MSKADFLIIGQGLAGTHIALELLNRGKKVIVISPGPAASSSYVAAGLMNPITGRRITPVWMADELLPFAFKRYRELEELLDTKFLHPVNVVREFPSAHEKELMEQCIREGDSAQFVEQVHDDFVIKGIRPFKHGAYELKQSGYLEVKAFLNASRKFLEHKDALIENLVPYRDINISPDEISIGEVSASAIIFCEGFSVIENPWFPNLPLHPLKGEIITVKAPELELKHKILTANSLFILPAGNHIFRAGATYERGSTDATPSESGKAELTKKLDNLLTVGYEIVNQEAGIRPAVKDRRPLLGKSKDFDNVFLFNGLGTKGVTLSPYFAWHLTNHVLNGTEILREVDWKRFK